MTKNVLLMILATLLSTSCFLFPGGDAEQEQSTDVPVVENEDGTVTYVRPDNTIEDDNLSWGEKTNTDEDDDREVVCFQRELVFEDGPHEITPAFQFVYKTFEGWYNDIEHYQRQLDSYDHLFLKEIKVTSLSGDDFRFVAWAKLFIHNPDLLDAPYMGAWGGPFEKNDYVVTLNVDGSFDLAPFLKKDNTSIYWELRGKSPQTKTFIKAEATFVGLFFCDQI